MKLKQMLRKCQADSLFFLSSCHFILHTPSSFAKFVFNHLPSCHLNVQNVLQSPFFKSSVSPKLSRVVITHLTGYDFHPQYVSQFLLILDLPHNSCHHFPSFLFLVFYPFIPFNRQSSKKIISPRFLHVNLPPYLPVFNPNQFRIWILLCRCPETFSPLLCFSYFFRHSTPFRLNSNLRVLVVFPYLSFSLFGFRF